MGAVLVKVLPILSMDSLLRGVSNFVNGYMGEALVKGVANFVNGLFVKRGLKIFQLVQGSGFSKTCCQFYQWFLCEEQFLTSGVCHG